MANKILVIGATSSLGVAICRVLASANHSLILCGRNNEELEILRQDLVIRYGIDVSITILDLAEGSLNISGIIDEEFDSIYMVAGDMGKENKNDMDNIESIININFTAPAKILTAISTKMEAKKQGCIVIVSSVAGDRGRQSNYPYGAAKAGLTVFASGLRNRLCKSGVHVMTVKPGFIDTPMTFSMNSPLIARREYVAKKIMLAAESKKDSIYVPFFWCYIMLIIRHIPEFIFKKMGL
jgi:decaprenylphospho-beta-D-erythro-pentofuranosid-2-ulose 2-reductase